MIGILQTALPPTLVVDGQVVGARVGGKWRRVEYRKGDWGKRPSSAFRQIGIGTLGTVTRHRFLNVEEGGSRAVFLMDGGNDDAIRVGGLTPRVPRKVTKLPANSPAYTKALRRFLDSNGLKAAKARIVGLWQADLDGDGTKEVLIEARSRDRAGMEGVADDFRPDDYSLVLLRALRGGKVVDLPLDFATKESVHPHLRAVADLDGDGRMEIVLSFSAYDNSGGSLWSYRAGRVVPLVRNTNAG